MSDDYVPCKNDIIINPLTNRGVVVGSQTWRKLVKQGVIKGHYKPNNVTRDIDDDDVSYAKKSKSKIPPKRITTRSKSIDNMSTSEIKSMLSNLMKEQKNSPVYPKKKEPTISKSRSKFKIKESSEEETEEETEDNDTEISYE